MTFDSREKSWEAGEPVEFYDFIRGTAHWRYNTSDRLLTRLENEVAVDYYPAPITRDRIQQGAERNKLVMTLTLPRNISVAGLWHPYPSSETVGVTIYGGHIDEDDGSIVWTGRVVSPRYSPEALTLMCEPTATTASKSALSQRWQRGCPHVLYKQGHGLCNAVKEDFAVVGTVTEATGTTVKAAEFSAFLTGRLAGGYAEWTTPDGIVERRSIRGNVGDSVVLMYGTNTLPVGTLVTVYPGCRHNWNDCNDYFNNGVNYGGDLYSPERSPFDSNPVF